MREIMYTHVGMIIKGKLYPIITNNMALFVCRFQQNENHHCNVTGFAVHQRWFWGMTSRGRSEFRHP